MATHSSTLAWKIPWMEEPGRLQSMGSRRVRHDWATSLSLFTFMHWRRTWPLTPVFLPGESQGRRSLVGCVYGVAQSWTRLKRFSHRHRNYQCRNLHCTQQTSGRNLKSHFSFCFVGQFFHQWLILVSLEKASLKLWSGDLCAVSLLNCFLGNIQV